jgi:LacI family transcriptional regulator
MSRRVTIDDVARLAEVHKATVSRALNARTRDQVNADTLKRVKRAARQLGYVPNAMARGLRTSRSMTIGVIIPDLMNPIFPPIIRGIERVLQPQGYTVLVATISSRSD